MTLKHLANLTLVTALAPVAHATLITAVPGPDDQGGMIMPMVTIDATSGTGSNPTAGSIQISFNVPEIPQLHSIQHWSPGNWFAETAAWRNDLSSPAGVGGTPVANAGNGDLFNNQYGFMFMSMNTMGMAAIPEDKSLGIRLDSISSPDLKSFNYGNADNRWDQVFAAVDSQVLWNGTMWHNYFTLPASAEPGLYTAVFEIFIADTPFTGTTGFAQYDAAAEDAMMDPAFTSAFVTYEFHVVPEPAFYALVGGLMALGVVLVRRRGRKGA